MKTKFLAAFMAVALIALAASPALAQTGYAKVKGKISDAASKPIPEAEIYMVSQTNGAKYRFKTDKKGEYYGIGITPGIYEITISKDGKQIWALHKYNMSLQKEDSLNVIDVDLAKEYELAKAGGQQPQMTEEQKKETEKVTQENTKIKGLNDMLAQSRAAQDAGNFDEAIRIMRQATQLDPTRDILWGRFAELLLASAKKDTDPASRTQKYTEAVTAYKKAIEITNASTSANAKASLGPYNNNLGEALAKTGKTEEAIAAYNTAAQVDPANAGNYYFNLGATFSNIGKIDEAIAAYDKSIAANPNKPESYYQKGISLLGKATLKGDKMIAAPGTEEAFNKYLELAPDGPYADTAKQMLASVGATVTTSYGKKKK